MTRGDIVFVNLPFLPGSGVQGGRRPGALVTAHAALKGNPLVMIVPLTTRLNAGRYPLTVLIEPSLENGLSARSVALVFQLRAVDPTDVEPAIGHLEAHYLAQIDEMMRQMLGI